MTLQLPRFAEATAIAAECAYLNFLEVVSWTGFPLLGCWHPHVSREGRAGVTFTTFVPNALYQPMLATNLALWMLWPELQDKRMADILEERFGKSAE